MIEVLRHVVEPIEMSKFFLTGKHQPKSVFIGVLICEKSSEKKIMHNGNWCDARYDYRAYAVNVSDSHIPVLVLYRQTAILVLNAWDDDGTFWDEIIYSKYLIPKDKMEVQKFDCPNGEEKFAMREEYEEFLKSLSEYLCNNDEYFYLTFEDILSIKG